MGRLPAEETVNLSTIIDPDVYGVGTFSSDWITVSATVAGNTFECIVILMVGAMSAGATVDFKIEQALDNVGTGAKDIAGKAITQLTQAGGDSGKQAIINLKQMELDLGNGFDFIRTSLTVGVASVPASAMGFSVFFTPVPPAITKASIVEVVT